MNDVSLGLVHEVEVMLRKVGATRENFWKPLSKNEELARRVVQVVNSRSTYDVVVDYNHSFIEMIKAGNYDNVGRDINERNFTVYVKDQHKVSVTLFNFSRNIESEDVMAEIRREDHRSAEIEEILALGEYFPGLQREFTIVALGSVWKCPVGGRRSVVLCGNSVVRCLELASFKGKWGRDCRFLAVHV